MVVTVVACKYCVIFKDIFMLVFDGDVAIIRVIYSCIAVVMVVYGVDSLI